MDSHAKSPLQGTPPSGAGETILLIEDDFEVRKILRLLLEVQGYRVITAGSGVEGLALFKEHQSTVRVTITDIKMRGMQGTEVIKELRAIDANARIVVISGFRDGRDLIPEEVGRLIFLSKPMSKVELIAAVRSLQI